MSASPTVLILAAGQGTRMRSAKPKVLHELCGLPMVLWPVRAALGAGAGKVVVVDSPARACEEVLPKGVELAVQPQSNGTGGAVQAAAEYVNADAPVVVLSGDVPLVSGEAISALVDSHAVSAAAATMATAVLDDPSGYGRVVRDSGGAVARVVETKKAGDATAEELQIKEVNSGIYVFSGAALLEALPRLSADNAQQELYLPQALDLLRSDGHAIAAHVVEDEGLMLGVNDRLALARVRAIAQRAICERHMLAGVTIVDPSCTRIDVDVQIGKDTTIEPFTSLLGATRIGERCTVRCSYLVDSTLHDGVSVGPFAYLRPGATLRDGAKAGTFVEIKNSDIGAGTKIPHLSYIGDADVGEQTNLGAGTITANYDGHSKHRTTIGSRVKGGVDTSLVAPVTLGDESYTAAGSVVTEDVPAGALAVARARQANVEGYSARRAREAADAAAAKAGSSSDGRDD
ncbi:MAG TPA: bifunctional UDP-N-acetylglucosamine diphosphorylase/glucosamine-1-phosphate N-acetyltransferase GlmU [Solirubrobacteraceae bacterium]|nr:bifunctional UDP-N-acetylglucosamine diphosphorylase/glucosamine-1-phosphate N-acetyltransferase GlmU [Solirubrobacteraceae bacterium]